MKYLILGAGPAGLTIGNMLKRKGEDSFLVLEKESVPGGLCRSQNVDGSPFDIGGGHFLDVKRPEINSFLFEFLPEQNWNYFIRDSRIAVNGYEIGHPFEANIWQMKTDDQIQYLKSIASAGCNRGEQMPEGFVEWIYWKLGTRIAEDYMLPYNQKMFSEELGQLGTYWLEKLPNVSFEETLKSCLEKRAYGTQPGHARFYYPKEYGYGEVWLRMGKALKEKLLCDCTVRGIDFDNHEIITEAGSFRYEKRVFITMPWTSFEVLRGMPEGIRTKIDHLKYSSVETRYFDRSMDTKAHWIYYPDRSLPYHRILVRSNFCGGSKGFWTETNRERTAMFEEEDRSRFHYLNTYAYPLNTIDKPAIMSELLAWAEQHDASGVGRWGEWEHYNSDVTVEKAIRATDKIKRS